MLTDSQRQQLIEAGIEAQKAAYAPYSKYQVGAAVLTGSGSLYLGANIENAAYPTTICAERVAIFKAVFEGQRDIVAISVITENGGFPCGACRQVLAEFSQNAIVLIADESGHIHHELTIDELLPGSFTAESLPVK